MKRAIIPFILALAAVAGATLLLSTDKDNSEHANPEALRETGAL